MNGVDVLLLAFDNAVSHQWESLDDAIKDLHEDESVWQPPAYAREPHDEGNGRPGAILWHLNHLEHCHRHYAAILAQRPVTQQPDTPPAGELPLKQILPRLYESMAVLRSRIAELKPDDLAQPCTSHSTTAEFICAFTRHVTWHAAQIKVARRLFRAVK